MKAQLEEMRDRLNALAIAEKDRELADVLMDMAREIARAIRQVERRQRIQEGRLCP